MMASFYDILRSVPACPTVASRAGRLPLIAQAIRFPADHAGTAGGRVCLKYQKNLLDQKSNLNLHTHLPNF
jgi:ethanolamine ammonia-lyase small subunit